MNKRLVAVLMCFIVCVAIMLVMVEKSNVSSENEVIALIPEKRMLTEDEIIEIAKLTMMQKYGEEEYLFYSEYKTTYNHESKTWYVEGVMPEPEPGYVIMGGVPMITIDGETGEVISFVQTL